MRRGVLPLRLRSRMYRFEAVTRSRGSAGSGCHSGEA